MTYCLAWRTKKSIYMFADSAGSLKGKKIRPNLPESSFKELHKEYNGYLVQENLLKLFRIRNDVTFCFAGAVSAGQEVANVLQKCLNEYGMKSVKNAFELATNSIRPINKENYVEILLAFIDTDKELVLLSYNRNGSLKIVNEKNDIIQIGSLPKEVKFEFAKLINIIKKAHKIKVQHYSVVILSFLQNYAQKINLMKWNVGGVFCSITLTDKGAKWMEDTTYVLYNFSNGIEHYERIIVGVREDSIIVSFKDATFFINNKFLEREIVEKLLSKAKNFVTTGKSKYYSFISQNSIKIAIVVTNFKLKNKHFDMSNLTIQQNLRMHLIDLKQTIGIAIFE